MACVRKRRGKWVADWRDGAGLRRWKTFDTKQEAEDFLDIERPKTRQWSQPVVAANISLDTYTQHWLATIKSTVRESTADNYQQLLRDHLLPTFGTQPVRQIHRGRIKSLLVDKLSAGLSKSTVRSIHATIRSVLRAAVDDGLLTANPAEKLGRQLRLVTSHTTRQEQIKAMTAQQRQTFLTEAKNHERWYPLFCLLAGTGLRLGEALALQWDDLDLANRTIRVSRSYSKGRLQLPKSGHGRTVDMSMHLTAVLSDWQNQRNAGVPWVFPNSAGATLRDGFVRWAMSRILKAAGLPQHFSPHCLRHTYASLLLQQGEAITYVQRQLGHASIQLTSDTYGKWLPTINHGAVDRLDAAQ